MASTFDLQVTKGNGSVEPATLDQDQDTNADKYQRPQDAPSRPAQHYHLEDDSETDKKRWPDRIRAAVRD